MSQLNLSFTKAVKAEHYPPRSQSIMQRRLLEYLDEVGDATNREIGKALGVDACSITGRCYELRVGGFIALAGRRKCTVTNNLVCTWKRVR